MIQLDARHRLLLFPLIYRGFGPSIFHLMVELVGIELLARSENRQVIESS